MRNEYRIARSGYAADLYIVQIRRWWFPVAWFRVGPAYISIEGARQFARFHAEKHVVELMGRI